MPDKPSALTSPDWHLRVGRAVVFRLGKFRQMQLPALQTIDSLGPSAFNTVVLAVPVDMMEIITSLKDVLRIRAS